MTSRCSEVSPASAPSIAAMSSLALSRRGARVGLHRRQLARVAPAPLAIAVQGDAGQPRAERRLPAEERQVADRAQPGLLHQVRRVGGPAGEPAEQAIDGAGVPRVEDPERLFVLALSNPPNQLYVVDPQISSRRRSTVFSTETRRSELFFEADFS